MKPLEGIKVVDLTTFVAAPCTCRLLADLGAEVIKVEHTKGDGWREFGMNFNRRFNEDQNPVFDIYNTGKKFIALNLKAPEAKEVMWKLLDQADVFVTNTRPDALKRLGFSYEDVKERCPKLIYAIVLGYGEEGPEATLPAFDTTAFWTRSGFLRDMAPVTENYIPISPPSSVGDTFTGTTLLAQICAAIIGRSRTGKGDYVSAGLYHNGIFSMGTMEIVSQKPWGNKYPRTRVEVGAPGGCYRCADDEWLFIANGQLSVALPKMFTMIERPDLIDDPRFLTRDARAENMEELYNIFANAYRSQTCEEWLRRAKEVDLPLVRMNHFSDVTTDEQALANGYVEKMTCYDGEEIMMPNSPIRMDSVGELRTTPAPKIGTHTVEILRDFGYSDEAIAAMEESGAIRTRKE